MIDPPGRRHLLAMFTALPALSRAGAVLAAPATPAPPAFPASPRLLVAGPSDGTLNRWADALQPALEQSLPPDTSIRRVEVGSADGVTGANQFEVRGVPDGMTVMLVPGHAALAWMVGDPRAQFDVGHWVPVVAGTASAIVVGKRTALGENATARIGAVAPGSPDLPALLGFQLLGAQMEPVFGIADAGAAQKAYAQGSVDAVLLHGPHLVEQLSSLAASGAQPLFTLGTLDENGRLMRDPAYPSVPHFGELYEARADGKARNPLYAAWHAAAAATRLEFGLVLQQLTPAAMVALWRHAGADALASHGVQATGATLGVQLLSGPGAGTSTLATAADAATLTELRRWLAMRFNWRPV